MTSTTELGYENCLQNGSIKWRVIDAFLVFRKHGGPDT